MTPEKVHEKYKIDDAVGVKDGEASYVFTVDIRDSKNAFEGTKPVDMAIFSRAVKSTFVGMASAASQSAVLDAVQVCSLGSLDLTWLFKLGGGRTTRCARPAPGSSHAKLTHQGLVM